MMEASQALTKRPLRGRNKKLTPSEVVSKAQAVTDPFAELNMTMELPYSRLRHVRLRSCTGSALSNADCEWMLKSVEELKSLYTNSGMGWDEVEKKNELRHPNQRYLIASHEELGERVAFLSYRWDVEEGQPIMYVYELGVADAARGNRIGCALMQYAEDLCRKLSVGSILLTVFVENRAAMSLYRERLKYVPTLSH